MNDIALDARGNTVLTPMVTGGRLRPNWVPLKNEPGQQMWIDKRKITIDPQYQRKINMRQVAKMVGNWNWVSCGAIEVSLRPGANHFFAVDGQHRWQAAMHLPEIKELPCLKFELDTVRDEAIAFLATNMERRMPTISDQFRALLIAGDPIAQSIDKLTDQYSRTIGSQHDGHHIACTSSLVRMMRENRAAMERVFPLIAELAAGHPMPAKLLQAFHRLERCMPTGQSLSDDRWRERVQRLDYTAIMEEIRRVQALDMKGGQRAWATGLLRLINKGLRQPLQANVDIVRR